MAERSGEKGWTEKFKENAKKIAITAAVALGSIAVLLAIL